MIFLSKNTKAILIAGPTASGKSLLALELAYKLNGNIINADSMQVYDTVRIITSRPSDQDMQSAPHYLYGHVSVKQVYSTGKWLNCIAKKIEELHQKGCLPIIVGGTGLYFSALIGQFSVIPDIPNNIRKDIRIKLDKYGSYVLHEELSRLDPNASEKINPADGQRIARAFEVLMYSGKSITKFWKKSLNPVIPAESAQKIIILPQRCDLRKRISERFKKMLDTGAIDEVRDLIAMDLTSDLPITKAIGIRHIISLLKGEMSYEETLQKGIIATNQYAKRQITWFCNKFDEGWDRITSIDEIL